MIDHVAINVRDLQCSRYFYEQALAPLGYVVRREYLKSLGFGSAVPSVHADPGGDFWLAEGMPFEPRSHIAFRAASSKQVQAFHLAALAAGGRCNGEPGLRPHYHAGYYAAYVLDPDGYNIEAVIHLRR